MVAVRSDELVARWLRQQAVASVRGCLFLGGPRHGQRLTLNRLDRPVMMMPTTRVSAWYGGADHVYDEAGPTPVTVYQPQRIGGPTDGGIRLFAEEFQVRAGDTVFVESGRPLPRIVTVTEEVIMETPQVVGQLLWRSLDEDGEWQQVGGVSGLVVEPEPDWDEHLRLRLRGQTWSTTFEMPDADRARLFALLGFPPVFTRAIEPPLSPDYDARVEHEFASSARWQSTPDPTEGDRVWIGQSRNPCICQSGCEDCPGDDGLFRTCSGCRHPRTVPEHADTLASIDAALAETGQ